ncbi:MAG: RagB/SusD family nutrient uptake outer membrane protein [Bacteroidota bacterium]
MKSSFFSLSICILLGLTSGCEGFLDRRPLDQLTSETFYRTEEEVRRGILAAYTPMMDNEWNGKGWMITEIPSDNSQPGGLDPDFTPIDNFTVAADNGPVGNYWAIHYRQIALANVVLDRVQEGVFTQDQLDLMLAEALFLRAVAYFDLVRVYGGVPLVTKAPQFGDDLLPSRATVEEVYALIREDLAFAADHLPLEWGGGDQGRATKGAALAYLSKVALTQRDFVPARDYAKAVMDLGVYRLMEDYADNFELGISDNNAEAIFQIQFTGCANFGTGNSLQAFFAPWGEGITKDRDGWGSQIPTSPQLSNPGTTILDAFEEDDARKPATVMTANNYYPTINAGDGGYTYPAAGASAAAANIKKYVVGSGPNICFMSTPQNSHLMRYSDMLLTYAESILEIEGGVSVNPLALDAFNQVRERAGLEPLLELTKEIMLQERRVEFAFEGHRWFDLVRSGRAVEILSLHGKNPDFHNLLFPIPLGEMEINSKLTQNPGY